MRAIFLYPQPPDQRHGLQEIQAILPIATYPIMRAVFLIFLAYSVKHPRTAMTVEL